LSQHIETVFNEVFEMAEMLQSITLLVLLGSLAAVCVIAACVLSVKHDAREPPLLPHSVPFFGHLIGMIRHGPRYLVALR
jgi:hypothetical protein